MLRSTLIIGVSAASLFFAQGTASAKECTIMGETKKVTEGTACPASLYDTLASLKLEKEIMRDGKKETEVDTFRTFLELADAAGFTGWLKGTEAPPKVHGESISEKAMTVFVPTDKALEGMKAEIMSDEKVLRKFVATHILPQPVTTTMMINKFADARATINYPESKRLDIFWLHGPRVANGSSDSSRITSENHISSNGVIHTLNGPIKM